MGHKTRVGRGQEVSAFPCHSWSLLPSDPRPPQDPSDPKKGDRGKEEEGRTGRASSTPIKFQFQ